MKNTENLTSYEKKVLNAEKHLKKALELMELIKSMLNCNDYYGAYAIASELADAVGKAILITRELPVYTNDPQAQKICDKIITDTMPVKIGFTPEGWFGVVMPALLPKRQKGSVDYIRDSLYLAMRNFFRGKQPVKYTNCVIIFRHIYRHDRPERQYRDHDNIEVNAVTDIIALHVLFDDSPPYCSHHYCSAAGDENRTEILVVPLLEFKTWMVDANSFKNKALVLFENLP